MVLEEAFSATRAIGHEDNTGRTHSYHRGADSEEDHRGADSEEDHRGADPDHVRNANGVFIPSALTRHVMYIKRTVKKYGWSVRWME